MLRRTFPILLLLCLPALAAGQGREWVVRLEEPTGIERRDNEVVVLKASFAAGQAHSRSLRMLDDKNREVPIQVAVSETHQDGSIKSGEILFPATLIPGQLPRYRLIAWPDPVVRPEQKGGEYVTDLVVRRLGISRVELGNSRFGIIINLGRDNTTPAIVEAYNRTSGEQRMLNLAETSPDVEEKLAFGVRSSGWGTFIGSSARTSGFTEVDIVESGPLRARVRLKGARFGSLSEEWEFEWTSNSPMLIWRTRVGAGGGEHGFFFSAISAAPYVPFTHWIGNRELGWPDGWETDKPPHIEISGAGYAGQNFDDLPGYNLLYYNPKENYGALAFIELDTTLKWSGAGSRQFFAIKKVGDAPRPPNKGLPAIERLEFAASSWSSQIGICFPRWRGTETALEARADYRRFARPVLAHVVSSQPLVRLPAYQRAARAVQYRIADEKVASARSGNAASDVVDLSLNGGWKLHHADKGEGEKRRFFDRIDDSRWQTVQVPGSVHTQIMKYPAYFTHEAEWISFKEWWYRKSFRVPATMKARRLRLRFEATDYYADVWLNGRSLGRHEGYIDPYEFDVSDKVSFDRENTIAVRVWTPVDYYWRHRPYTVKGSYGAVDQKPDDITPMGITRPVHLIANGRLTIEDVSPRTLLNSDGSATVEVEVSLDGIAQNLSQPRLEITLQPRNFEGSTRLKAIVDLTEGRPRRAAPTGVPGKLGVPVKWDSRQQRATVKFHIEKPRLWWTWDHGRPDLYTLTTRVVSGGRVSDERSQAVGIREIEKISWVFYINGRRCFIRGTNSYYLDLFMSEMNREKYQRDLKLMKDMNVNMIRLHCHFQNPEFYELCDELGILVWQDFLEAWYPRDPEFALKAAELYDPHIRMVRHHPSVAIWATSDEEDLENYRVLTKHLAGRLYVVDHERRPVVRSTGRYGDGHIYYGWYGGNIWEYTKTEEKFISELGATALPNYETLTQFLPNHWPIDDHKEEWIFRKLQITEAMRAWGPPDGKSLKEYIPQTQAYVARLHQLAIERMRRRKYDAGGILHFHAIDFWPSVTMAALDYFRKPTKSYWTVQRSFQMVLASVEYDRDVWKLGEELRCPLWVINDHWYALPGSKVKWRIIDARGTEVTSGEKAIDIAEDSSMKLDEIRWAPSSAGNYEMRTQVLDRQGKQISENLYEFQVK